jgi:hypothetical protein
VSNDVEDDLPMAGEEEDSGELTPDLFAGIRIAPKLLLDGRTKMRANAARDYVRDQLVTALTAGGGTYLAGQATAEDLEATARAIVYAMPADAMYEEVITRLDLRPYLAAVVKRGRTRWEDTRRDVTGDQRIGEYREFMLNGLSQTARDRVAVSQQGSDRTEAERAEVDEAIQGFDESVAGLKPELMFENRAAAIGASGMGPDQAEEALYDLSALGEEATAAPIRFPETELRSSMDLGDINDLAGLNAAELEAIKATGASGFVPVRLSNYEAAHPSDPGGSGAPTTLNAADAAGWLKNQSESDIERMQESLLKAGYYDSEDGELQFERGYAQDPATKQAWRTALFEAAEQNKSLPTLLTERSVAREERKRYERETFQSERAQLWKNNDNRRMFRDIANDYAIEQIGRRLTGEEYEAVRSTIDRLRDSRAEDVEPEDRYWETESNRDRGFDSGDIERAVGRRTSSEQGRMMAYDALQKVADHYGYDPFDDEAEED